MKHDVIKKLYSSGYSLSEVAVKVKMSSSGVKYILKKEKVQIRTRSDAVRIKHHKRLDSYSCSLPKKVPISLKKLYITGLALYWGEGSKTGNTVAIANSDPFLILTFLDFLRKVCHVDEKRLHILIHYHNDQNEKKLVTFWSNLTKIDKKQFYTSTIHTKVTKDSTKRLKFGTISLRYADSILHKDIVEGISSIKVKSEIVCG
jgi:hypothetical protein